MKYLFLALMLAMGLFAGCSSKKSPYGSYERANAASEKAHDKFDKE